MKKLSKHGLLFWPTKKSGFSLVELLVSIIILAIMVGVAIGAFQVFIAKAWKITMQHDLRDFIKAQEHYMIDHGHYLGASGDFVQYDQPSSGTLSANALPFTPSEGIRIEIISGNGLKFSGPPDFKVIVRHVHSNLAYEYNFTLRQTKERKH
ncbi:MAG: type II secretion system protein [Deltaproteobacteria bacterium]|nr:type II secretion system protein [Deltaproteobacteria bacterium]